MNKCVVFLASGLLALSGCSSDGVPEYVKNKILKDKEGCAYVVRQGSVDIVYLDFVKDVSDETCAFKVKE